MFEVIGRSKSESMKLQEKYESDVMRDLVLDKAILILEEVAKVSTKLWELQFFPTPVRDALAFCIVVCHFNRPNFFEVDLSVIFQQLEVSPELLLRAADHWAGLHNYVHRDELRTRISEMTSFYYGEQPHTEDSQA